MLSKIVFIVLINAALSLASKAFFSSESEVFGFLAGQGIFTLSLLAQVVLVKKFLNPSDGLNQNGLQFVMVMCLKFLFLGASLWISLDKLNLPPYPLVGGLVVGLMVFSLVFYFSGKSIQTLQAASPNTQRTP